MPKGAEGSIELLKPSRMVQAKEPINQFGRGCAIFNFRLVPRINARRLGKAIETCIRNAHGKRCCQRI